MKYTPGPWTLELIQKFPWGVRIMAGDYEILHQHAICHSTDQKNRKQCEQGIGFKWGNEKFCSREQAIEQVKTQDANARLIAAAPELLQMLKVARQEFDKCCADTEGTVTQQHFAKILADCDNVIRKAESNG